MKHECEGDCVEHIGEVKRYSVFDEKIDHDWGSFWYCETAVATDRESGFTVNPDNVTD